MPRSPRATVFSSKRATRPRYRSQIPRPAPVSRYYINLEIPSLEVGEALLDKAKQFFVNCSSTVFLNVCPSSLTLDNEDPPLFSIAASADSDGATSTEPSPAEVVRELLYAVDTMAGHQATLSGILVKHQAALDDLQAPKFLTSAVVREHAETVRPSVPAPKSETTEPQSFAELSDTLKDVTSLPAFIAADKKKNRELANVLYILPARSNQQNPSRCDENLADKIITVLNLETSVLETRRVMMSSRNEVVEVVLKTPNAAEICAKFRKSQASVAFPQVVLKAKRSLLLRYAMFRMFRTVDLQMMSSAPLNPQVEGGWYVKFEDGSCFSPYAFLYPEIRLKSGLSISVCPG